VSSAHLTVSEFGTRCRVRRGGVERIRGSDRWNLSDSLENQSFSCRVEMEDIVDRRARREGEVKGERVTE
jgi:hypothetical protein